MAEDFLPGTRGKDYTFVKHGGNIYVVYTMKVGGKTIRLSYRVPADRVKDMVGSAKVNDIGGKAFRQLNFFGTTEDITAAGGDEHPFEGFVRNLREEFGNVSWLHDREVMEIFMMGHLEGMDSTAILNRVKQTDWYQGRTDRQREWELEISDEQKQVELEAFRTRMLDELQNGILGAGFTMKDLGINAKEFEEQVKRVTSGKLGNPEEGYLIWRTDLFNKAAKLEGTLAWIERDQQAADQNAHMNKPEEMRQRIGEEAFEWLGPRGVPDNEILQKWADRLVSGERSDADWQQFLRNQATNLYPFLGPEERWQERASTYKRIAENLFGKTIGWDHAVLDQMAGTDTNGAPTGAAADFGAYEKAIRQTDEFWQGPVANDEAFAGIAKMNSLFNGVES
jgi:hypothetical protein